MKTIAITINPGRTTGELQFYDTRADSLDLDAHLTQLPAATCYMRAQGDSMIQLGIYDGDLLVVDTLLEPAHGDVVIVELNGEKACKVLDLHFYRLLSGNDTAAAIKLNEQVNFTIEGVVTHSLRYHRDASPLLARCAASV